MSNLKDLLKRNSLFYCCTFVVLVNFALIGGSVYAVAKSTANFDLARKVDTESICKVSFFTFNKDCQGMLKATSLALKPILDRVAHQGLLLMFICMVLLILLVIFRRKE